MEIDYAGHVNTVCARGHFFKYLLLNYWVIMKSSCSILKMSWTMLTPKNKSFKFKISIIYRPPGAALGVG